MGNVTLDNQTFPDRRKNGARLKLCIRDWFKMGIVIVGIIWGYAVLTNNVWHQGKALAKQEEKVEEVGKTANDNEKDIESMKESIKRIDENVKELVKALIRK